MVSKSLTNQTILALDVGSKRIGSAIAGTVARLPRPYGDFSNDGPEAVSKALQAVIDAESVDAIVVGVPRNLQGEETAQSEEIRSLVASLEVTVPFTFVDESLSSVRADAVTADGQYPQASRDSLAACFILEEYLQSTKVAS
jgi:putative holliday junction resolvase